MKMNFPGRIILFIAGLALAWCSLWGASEMKAWVVSLELTEKSGPGWTLLITSVIALVVGGWMLVQFIKRIQQDVSFDDAGEVLDASLQLICFAFLFGAIVAPLGNGNSVGEWMTPWVFLLVLGFLPAAFVVHDIVIDIMRPGAQKDAHDATVTRLHQR